MLQILEGWDLNRLDDVHRVHLVVEAMRRAYRDRMFFLGDPDFVSIPQRVLTSQDYARGLRAAINPEKAMPSVLLSGHPTPLRMRRRRIFQSLMRKETGWVRRRRLICYTVRG